jgi:hypothetical protein
MLQLYPQLPEGRVIPGGRAASFIITGPHGKQGDEVLAGDTVGLKIVEAGGYLKMEDYASRLKSRRTAV